MQYCLTKGCSGKLAPCFVEGTEQAYECSECGAVYEITEDLDRKARRFDLDVTPVHRLTLAEVMREPELVSLDEWDRGSEEPDPALHGFREVHVTSKGSLSRRPLRRSPAMRLAPLANHLAAVAQTVDPEIEEEVPLAERDFDPLPVPNPRAWMRP